jgi:CDP-paratose 2-epimerase
MSIDPSLHSIFGASKVAADVLVQEYGRYFGLRTACFRGGTLTGPRHSAAELHGFLAYIMRCAMTGAAYTVYGYKGKQVRDAIHSHDLIRAFDAFFKAPRSAEVYNIGGGRFSNASVLEAIELAQEISGEELDWTYDDTNRHRRPHLVDRRQRTLRGPLPRVEARVRREGILGEIWDENRDRWRRGTRRRARPAPSSARQERRSSATAAMNASYCASAVLGRASTAHTPRRAPPDRSKSCRSFFSVRIASRNAVGSHGGTTIPAAAVSIS